jgi:hypothetical protein
MDVAPPSEGGVSEFDSHQGFHFGQQPTDGQRGYEPLLNAGSIPRLASILPSMRGGSRGCFLNSSRLGSTPAEGSSMQANKKLLRAARQKNRLVAFKRWRLWLRHRVSARVSGGRSGVF